MARRQADARRIRLLAGVLVVALAVTGVVILLLLAGRGGAPPASPTGGAGFTPSPSATTLPTPSATASLTPAPSPSPTTSAMATGQTPPAPTASAVVTPPPTAAVTPSPTAPAGGTGPRRELLLDRLGIDNISAPEAMPRLITFDADGPGDIVLTLQRLSVAQVTMCLWQGAPDSVPAPAECQVMSNAALMRSAPPGRSTWTASIIGAQPGRSPWARLHLRFPSHAPSVRLTQFRFQGLPNPDYNGFTAQVTARAAGLLRVAAQWDDEVGGSYPYRLRVDDLTAPLTEPLFDEGTDRRVEVEMAVAAEHQYLIFIENRSENFHERVLISATLAWP